MGDTNKRRPVRPLSVDVARKIAAGEVIDRPCAIVRELLDNAVDSGASSISVEIEGGGIDKIRIADNGYGMSLDDLKNCARPHCTSKISESEDLLNLTTLGFRGEALASIAAVSRLSISSGTYRMKASITEDHEIEKIPPVQDGKGTIVMSEGLFENFPARRHFLKRPASENMMCREVFTEKSLPRPDISFRLTVDGSLRHDLPGGVSLAERFARALELKENTSLFSEIKSCGIEADGVSKWSFSLVIGEPGIYRNDRKQIFIFVNGRRVQEFSLIQAIEYGCQGFFPNGTHPVAALFLNVEPKLVDFNIHPAKKEVRFKDISSVHHGVSTGVRNYLRSQGIRSTFERDKEIQEEINKAEKNTLFNAIIEKELERDERNSSGSSQRDFWKHENYSSVAENAASKNASVSLSKLSSNDNSAYSSASYKIDHTRPSYSESLAETALSFNQQNAQNNTATQEPSLTGSIQFKQNMLDEKRFSIPGSSVCANKEADFIYYGTIFGTFLMVQKNGIFYLIDQHAAHERILFNRLMSGGSETQELLVPYEIQTESKEDDEYLSSMQVTLSTAGFKCENQGSGKWIFTSVPARWQGNQEDLKKALFEKHVSPEEIIYQIAAMTACKAAVKDGTILGPEAAENLAREALLLKDPHCPHGRPCWTTLTKEELFDRVRRTR
ncbi:DNA mismatch repair endonuclease MutL [uncultured Treponema sp.]|uniref:DNA mismatch repair endonuclease MutL n=1 Tax=uncultured Treponema sp. TaxID=162155 RepID=UPI0025F72658|nr:DNA mismatch repair endonuclease MutL [uncultured Treponema sp.]